VLIKRDVYLYRSFILDFLVEIMDCDVKQDQISLMAALKSGMSELGPKKVVLSPKLDKSGIFKNQISVRFALVEPNYSEI